MTELAGHPLAWALAWLGLLAWLVAGTLDFACHRRTDLPQTSGVAESTLHLVQLGLVGAAILLGMLFAITTTVVATMALLVLAHAVVGYLDTRQAYPRRPILPFEQHVHSVLDMAPWIALGLVVAATWPAAIAGEWSLALRDPPLPARAWLMVLLPAAVLAGLPAVMEWRAAWRARASRTSAPGGAPRGSSSVRAG